MARGRFSEASAPEDGWVSGAGRQPIAARREPFEARADRGEMGKDAGGIAEVEFALPLDGELVERRIVAERGEGGIERAEVFGGNLEPHGGVEDDARLAR